MLFIVFGSGFLSAQKTEDNQKENVFVLKSDKPKFSIEFPAKYKLEESKTDNGLKTEFYRCEKNGNIFMFKYTEHENPAVSPDNKTYTEASLQSFIDGIKAELISKYYYKIKKQKGLEAFLKIPDKNLHVFYRITIVKHVQYQIIVITKSDKKTDDISSFFNSFDVR